MVKCPQVVATLLIQKNVKVFKSLIFDALEKLVSTQNIIGEEIC